MHIPSGFPELVAPQLGQEWMFIPLGFAFSSMGMPGIIQDYGDLDTSIKRMVFEARDNPQINIKRERTITRGGFCL